MECNHLHRCPIVQEITLPLIKIPNINNNLPLYTAVEQLKDLQCQDIQADNQDILLQLQFTMR